MGLLGGSSSSKSSSTSSTVQQDMRIVADAQAQAASAGGVVAKDYAQPINIDIGGGNQNWTSTSLNIMQTDYGAIDGALTFADKASANTNKTVQDILGVSKQTFDQTTTALSEAYKDAKGGALVLQTVTIAMMATIATIAYFWLGKKK